MHTCIHAHMHYLGGGRHMHVPDESQADTPFSHDTPSSPSAPPPMVVGMRWKRIQITRRHGT